LILNKKKQIKELYARDLQLRKIIRFWISQYPLQNKLIMDSLNNKEGICFFELPRDDHE